MIDEDELLPLVVENGSGKCKIGFGTEDAPRYIFQNCIRQSSIEDFYIGDDAQNRRDLSFSYPIQHGVITDWDDMQKIWDNCFYQKLQIIPKCQPILLTEPPLNPIINRERMAQTMFELYNFPSLSIVSKDLLSSYTACRTSGIILGLGDGVIYVTPFYEGHTLPHVVTKLDFGGHDLTEYLMSLLSMNNYSFSTTSEREIVQDIKETCCYIATDYNLEKQKAIHDPTMKKKYSLSEGDNIFLAEERFKCPEALFQPSLLGFKSKGIHEILYDTIMNCDIDMRRDLCSGVILSGGTSHFPGLAERLKKELAEIAPARIRIISNTESQYFSWIGGSILSTLSLFKSFWIKKSDYEEFGPSIVRRNVFY